MLGEKALRVPLYKSKLVRLSAPATRVSVGNPDVADILIVRSNQLYVLGKDLGTTNVLLWDRQDVLIDSIEVEVTHDLQSLKKKLYELLPNENIEVRSAQRNIILSGNVSNVANMDAALKIARGYFAQFTAVDTTEFEQEESGADQGGGEVINLMSVGGVQQVMLEVKVAEISRTELRRLDVRFNSILKNNSNWSWGAVNGGAAFPDAVFPPDDTRIPVFDGRAPLGPVIDEFAPNDLAIADKGFFASFLNEDALFNVAFDIVKENGLAKILAEPTLTTQTGQAAEFLSGGEFPIPVPQGGANNAVTIEFKEFGVGVKFVPVVLDNERINLKLNMVWRPKSFLIVRSDVGHWQRQSDIIRSAPQGSRLDDRTSWRGRVDVTLNINKLSAGLTYTRDFSSTDARDAAGPARTSYCPRARALL